MYPLQDLTGQRFGRLVALAKDEKNRKGGTYWICRCDCGEEKSIRRSRLVDKLKGRKTCGCFFYEIDEKGKKYRLCKRCNINGAEKLSIRGHSSYCRKCTYEMQKESKERNPDIKLRMKAKKYGISLEKYKELLSIIGQECPMCLRVTDKLNPFVIDHDHVTNKFRGIICSICNLLLGHAKDSPEILERLAIYLRDADRED